MGPRTLKPLNALAAAALVSACGSKPAAPAREPAPESASEPAHSALQRPLVSGHVSTCLFRGGSGPLCWGAIDVAPLVNAAPAPELAHPRPFDDCVGIGASQGGWCLLLRDGRVRCSGLLGTGEAASDAPVLMELPEPATGIAVAPQHACAVLKDRRVACWGNNEAGQSGAPAAKNAGPHIVEGVQGAVDLAIGILHSCALLDDGQVLCWGGNEAGVLGDGTTTARHVPAPVIDLPKATRISASKLHTCALVEGGEVRCWGLGDDGQLGDGVSRPVDGSSSRPVAVKGIRGATDLSVGNGHSCALVGGAAWCWGANSVGQLGDGTTHNRAEPVAVKGLQGLVWISAGGGHTCALDRSGDVWCWGNGFAGQTGQGVATKPAGSLITTEPARVGMP